MRKTERLRSKLRKRIMLKTKGLKQSQRKCYAQRVQSKRQAKKEHYTQNAEVRRQAMRHYCTEKIPRRKGDPKKKFFAQNKGKATKQHNKVKIFQCQFEKADITFALSVIEAYTSVL